MYRDTLAPRSHTIKKINTENLFSIRECDNWAKVTAKDGAQVATNVFTDTSQHLMNECTIIKIIREEKVRKM